uniref:Restriction endonuclease HNH n=1 Tax=Clandestinovirus TaxID=2831644 RepID=A0A8F8PKE7_9VIRU|nr:restriction endonuclease HNH [Clandestinovirus]
MSNKICVECKVEQDITNFYPEQLRCKPCYASYRRKYKTPESIERHRVTASKYRLKLRQREKIEIVGEKKCWACKNVKPRTEFTPTRSTNDGVGGTCKPCAREIRIKETQKRRDIVNNWIKDHGGKCANCGNADREVFDLDHCRGQKVRHISRLVLERRPIEMIEAELEKVQILCVNCHRYKTAKERPPANQDARYSQRVAYVNTIKREIGGCQLCEMKTDQFDDLHLQMFDFDHVDRANKCGVISWMRWATTIEKLNEELAKCRLLCANCHRKVSLRQQESALVRFNVE